MLPSLMGPPDTADSAVRVGVVVVGVTAMVVGVTVVVAEGCSVYVALE